MCPKKFSILNTTNVSSENGRSMLKHDKSESGAVQLRSHPSILKKRTKSTEVMFKYECHLLKTVEQRLNASKSL